MKLFVVLMSMFSAVLWEKPSNNAESYAYSYIDTYRDVAVIEMHRSGIPASIILAQGLLESNYGTSELSTEAHNHFGIKCKSYWQGDTFYHEDDDYDIRGKLIDSCFRKYNSSVESYVDHSNFFIYTAHYQELFSYDKYDYKSWAYGLKKCGYATDKRYAEKLISMIEKYELYHYDGWDVPFRTQLK